MSELSGTGGRLQHVWPDETARLRSKMVSLQIEARGVCDRRVLNTMRVLPRHLFVPEETRGDAYDDRPLSIGHGATISQPLIVAMMTEALGLQGTERVLEIGTGSGYQTAVLCELAGEVFSIEIDPDLANRASRCLSNLGYRDRLRIRVASGEWGWPEEAPFDRILMSAAADEVPRALLKQLANGGRLVAPIGPEDEQKLVVIDREGSRYEQTELCAVRFMRLRTSERRRKAR